MVVKSGMQIQVRQLHGIALRLIMLKLNILLIMVITGAPLQTVPPALGIICGALFPISHQQMQELEFLML